MPGKTARLALIRSVSLRNLFWGLCFPLLFGPVACTTTSPGERILKDFVIVRMGPEDDFSSLAAKYLHDPAKASWIAEFNSTASPRVGQEVVIPLKAAYSARLSPEGYQTVPVLTYYGFSRDGKGPQSVPESAFREQMAYLKDNGYQVISLDRFMDFLNCKSELPQKSVVITFDDGWRSVYDIAFPVMREYGFPATLFIYTDFIGGGKALSWKQLNELAEHGFEIQSKTVSHRNLTNKKAGESFEDYFKAVKTEISESKRIIERRLNRKCLYMAYPYGRAGSLIIAVLKEEGYRGAFTLNSGGNPFFVDNFLIHRTVIGGETDLNRFKDCLSVFTRAELK